ncbi:hypothetical protein GCM10027299_00420 [Larkinella ripae]
MKTVLSFLLIVFVALACDQSKPAVFPFDELYKRWKSVEITQNGKDWRVNTPVEVLEFLPDGTIRYDNQDQLCCSPVEVSRYGTVLKVRKIGRGINGYCAQVSCVSLTEMRLAALSETELIIEYWSGSSATYVIRYTAVP